MGTILIYGATGYTGTLLAEHALARGLRPILAGRDPDKLRPLARRLALESRAARLDEPERLRAALNGVAAAIHAAGPFSKTARPMAEACLAAGAHYVDITGEISGPGGPRGTGRGREGRRPSSSSRPRASTWCPATASPPTWQGGCPARRTCASRSAASAGSAGAPPGPWPKGIAWGTRVRRDGRIVELPSPPRGTADFGYAVQTSDGGTGLGRRVERVVRDARPQHRGVSSRPSPPWRPPRACRRACGGSSPAARQCSG